MTEPQLRELLADHMVPLLAGTKLGLSELSSPRHALVAYEHPCALLMKPSRNSAYRVRLVRSQAFTPAEKQLVGYFIGELSEIVQHAAVPQFRELMMAIPRRVISRLLPGPRG